MNWLKFQVLLGFLALATARSTRPVLPHHDPFDVFRAIGGFPSAFAISTSSNDTSFKCLKAVLTRYNLTELEATYTWRFGGYGNTPRRTMTFDITLGNTTDRAVYHIDNDKSRTYSASIAYTDYESCIVAIIPTREHDHCMLWAKREVANAVPQACLDYYEATCEIRVPQFDSSLCTDDE
ncbi:uncharacterized protein LOC144148648 [Haemaphysalis longicornis]